MKKITKYKETYENLRNKTRNFKDIIKYTKNRIVTYSKRRKYLSTYLAPDARKADLLLTNRAALGIDASTISLNMERPKYRFYCNVLLIA